MLHRFIPILAIGPVLTFATTHVSGQGKTVTAELRGAVIDPTGAGVPGADVVVFRTGGTVAHLKTGERGEFSFAARPREYQVIVRAPGFADLRSGPVPFASGSTTNFTVRPGTEQSSGSLQVDSRNPSAILTQAQGILRESPVRQNSERMPWEYGVLAQGGVGTEDRSDYKFLLVGVHLGKILTPNVGAGFFQGNFEYAVEVFPFWQSYTPRFQKLACSADPPAPVGSYTCSQPYTVGGTYTGVSVTPIVLRWNFTHGERWMPWVQGAGGVVWTNHKYPAVGNLNPLDTASNGPHGDTSVWNFTPQFGVGTHYFLRPRQSLDISANAVHISSSSLGDKNPGVNASVQFSLGYTWWK